MKTFEMVIGIICIITSCYSIYITIKHTELKRRLKRYYWKDVENGIKELSLKIEKRFIPDVILSVSGSSSIVSNLYITQTAKFIPIITAFSLKNGDKIPAALEKNYSKFDNQNWSVYLPKDLLNYKNSKLLIIDDVIITGTTLFELKKHLTEMGFRDSAIFSSALFCSDLAIERGISPDCYTFKTEDRKFYFPWGPCNGSGGTINN